GRASLCARGWTVPGTVWVLKGGEHVMTGTKSSLAQELGSFYEALCLDLPVEATKTLLGMDNEKQLRKAGWKAYDAWISVANELTNIAYSNRLIGEVTGRAMDSALRFRQLSATVTSAL